METGSNQLLSKPEAYNFIFINVGIMLGKNKNNNKKLIIKK
jgi:hypothetical protein